MYQQVNLSDHTLVGLPGPLPANLVGLPDSAVADISAVCDPPPPGMADQGWWPVIVATPPSFDPLSQIAVGPTAYTVDPATRTVSGQQTARAMTADEFAAVNPVPGSVTNYQGKAALVASGLFDKVDTAIKGADMNVIENKLALLAWTSGSFIRTSSFIVALGPKFGLSATDIDNLFRAAARVT